MVNKFNCTHVFTASFQSILQIRIKKGISNRALTTTPNTANETIGLGITYDVKTPATLFMRILGYLLLYLKNKSEIEINCLAQQSGENVANETFKEKDINKT